MSSNVHHQPVMAQEVVDVLRHVPPGLVVDATVGAGGHAVRILRDLDHVEVLGIDRDDEALRVAEAALAPYRSRVGLVRARFDDLGPLVEKSGHSSLSGLFMDLGVSSMQLDQAGRGFSYRHDGPLDMRMDRREDLSAREVVNGYDQSRLAALIRTGSDERYAGRIAAAIVAARPIETTEALAGVIAGAIPAPARRRGGHPAKRTFQSLRVEVNSELSILASTIDVGFGLLAPGGVCAVLTYHSGEDRIVKDRFMRAAGLPCRCPTGLPCRCPASHPAVKLLWRKARRPCRAEIDSNSRSSSARLRAAEKVMVL